MNLQHRIELLQKLEKFLSENNSVWNEAKTKACQKNPWFTEAFIDTATKNIAEHYLQKELLEKWIEHYHLDDNIIPKNIGIVMAGNIPMVGFHDFLCAFVSGHNQTIKLSSRDDVLMKCIVDTLQSIDNDISQKIQIAELLKGRDAYIATGSNNTAFYFHQYFSKYPHIIRKNKTSVAVLSGEETAEELSALADDIHLFFGLGCRNVTKIYVPQNYDFVPLLQAFDTYKHFADMQKYKNNYDYQLSILLLNRKYYMTNGATLLVENKEIFSAISVVHYEFYDNSNNLNINLNTIDDLQCISGKAYLSFGQAQQPGLFTYADGVDSMQFLLSL